MKSLFNKSILIVLLALLVMPSPGLKAGGPAFRELSRVKLSFTPSIQFYTHTDDFKYFLCSNKTDMLMLDGITGKTIWQTNFEKDFKNAKFSNQFWNMESNVILVYDEDTKKGVATKYFIDGKTGKVLWTSDKYVSDFGEYELSTGFSNYYDPETGGVLLPTKESVDLVEVTSGKTIWSKPFALTGKAKNFDCYIMNYYDLVCIVQGKENSIYLTTIDGKEVTDIEPYFNKKKYMADRQHAFVVDIPEKNMYVLMQGETNKLLEFLGGINIPKWKMNFKAYDATTDKLLWNKQYTIAYTFDWISYEPLVYMFYDEGLIFVEHDPNLSASTGLTVLDPATGNLLWEANYTTSEIKNSLTKAVLTPFPSPMPVTVDGKTYIVNKTDNVVCCYDSHTGKKVWQSEKFPDAQKIPTLIVYNGLVIMKHGGEAKKVLHIPQSNGGGAIHKYEYNNKDKYGIIAYDAATGKIVWSDETIKKAAKDNFSYVADLQLIDGKLFCATDNNFFIIDPKTGNITGNLPVSKEKLGNAWKMNYFEKQQKLVINCENGIIKINPRDVKIEGVCKTPTVAYDLELVNYDDYYSDYAVFTSGNAEEFKFKEFASIDLDKMAVRGVEDGELLFYDIPHFSEGAEMFYKVDGSEIIFFSVK